VARVDSDRRELDLRIAGIEGATPLEATGPEMNLPRSRSTPRSRPTKIMKPKPQSKSKKRRPR